MRKTSVYLSDVEYAELKRLAAETGKSEASIVREAITEYGERRPASRRFRSAAFGASRSGAARTAEKVDKRLREGVTRDAGWR